MLKIVLSRLNKPPAAVASKIVLTDPEVGPGDPAKPRRLVRASTRRSGVILMGSGWCQELQATFQPRSPCALSHGPGSFTEVPVSRPVRHRGYWRRALNGVRPKLMTRISFGTGRRRSAICPEPTQSAAIIERQNLGDHPKSASR